MYSSSCKDTQNDDQIVCRQTLDPLNPWTLIYKPTPWIVAPQKVHWLFLIWFSRM